MDVTKLTPEQTRSILDFVLENSYHPRDYWNVQEDLLKYEEYFPNHDGYLLKMSLNQLKQDGYIDFIVINGAQQIFLEGNSAGVNMTIRRNFKGHIFLANGGYKGEELRRIANADAEKAAAVRDEGYASSLATWTERLAVRTRNLMIATWGVATGAIGLVLWEIIHTLFLEGHQ
jgi:hypothetical protein